MTDMNRSYAFVTVYSYSTNQIYDAFRDHLFSLRIQQMEVCRTIREWAANLHNHIQAYESQQTTAVEQAYQSHRGHLEKLRDEFVNRAALCRQNRDEQQMNRLNEKCKALQVELVKFAYETSETQFIKATAIDPAKQYYEDQPSANAAKELESERSPTASHAREATHDRPNHSGPTPASIVPSLGSPER